MRWMFVVTALVWGTMVAAAPAQAGGTCPQAQRELRRAQQALSEAARHYDGAAAKLHGCMKDRRGQPCRAEKKALDAAAQRRLEARQAVDFAREQTRLACR